MKLYFLSGGILDADRSVVHPGDDSKRRVTLPVTQVLIQSEGQTVLFDTGLPPAAFEGREGMKREYDMDPSWITSLAEPCQRVDAQLSHLGIKPSNLDLVVNTHFHFDHCGGNRFFAGVPIAAQEAELDAAYDGDYMPLWDAPGLQFRTVKGDWSPLPGVEMILTPGHTPGHQSMLVRFPEEYWLFTFDVVYTEEHWREDKLGAVKDVDAARQSLERLRKLAEQENAKLIFGHDVSQWASMGMSESKEPRLIVDSS